MEACTHQRVKRITQSIIACPTLPTVIAQMIGLIDRPDTSAGDMAALIGTDQVLTATVLKLANSAAYGYPRGICTVDHAIELLGCETVKSLGLNASVLDRYAGSGRYTTFDRQRFWEHTIACAVGARFLAGKLHSRSGEEAYTAGLLHDIGRLILSQFFPEVFNRILTLVRNEGVYIGEAEQRILGVTHTEIGCWLAERWNLPHRLVDAIRYHHAPGSLEHDAELPALIHLTDFICRRQKLGHGGGRAMPRLDPAAVRPFCAGEDPQVALQRIIEYGDLLRQEMHTAVTVPWNSVLTE